MSSQLELVNIHVSYGSFEAVRGVSMALDKGGIGCLLGPSGCGKTTLLRAIAGFESVSAGEITLNGKVISSPTTMLAPEQRKIGMVFQDFALFPHLNVQKNIGFGLSSVSADERSHRVGELLELIGLADSCKAYPHELSGGQQQRVALARAMAPKPELLLLDEPFSSLDSELREQLATEVRQILKDSGITAILVSHDQHEAFAMADHIALINQGEIAQAGTPIELYNKPRNRFVANFIGQGSIVNATINDSGELNHGMGRAPSGSNVIGPVEVLLRPEAVVYDDSSNLQLTVHSSVFRGGQNAYTLQLEDGQLVHSLTGSNIHLQAGEQFPARFDMNFAVLLDQNTS
ncbi:MAG: ABC transporter ATP-binding protein [Halioglobus sp.]